jgi:hypothetical protein
MTRPFGRGRDLEECCVIFRGSSLLCMHFELLHCTCMINFGCAWTWLACNNLWDLHYGVWRSWELELVVILWWSLVVISFSLSYDLF